MALGMANDPLVLWGRRNPTLLAPLLLRSPAPRQGLGIYAVQY